MTGRRIAATVDIEDTCENKGRARTKAIRDIKGMKTKGDHFFLLFYCTTTGHDAGTAFCAGLVFIKAWSNRTLGDILPSLRKLSNFNALAFNRESNLFFDLGSCTGITRTDGICVALHDLQRNVVPRVIGEV